MFDTFSLRQDQDHDVTSTRVDVALYRAVKHLALGRAQVRTRRPVCHCHHLQVLLFKCETFQQAIMVALYIYTMAVSSRKC